MDNPGVRSWLIACDESGVHGSPHYGFGSLWLKWQRRGDFFEAFRSMKNRHRFRDECKWHSVNAARDLDFYGEVLDHFFRRQWLAFHCLVVRRDIVKKAEFHGNSWDLARRKHFTMLLTNKMRKSMNRFPHREHEFRVYVDPITSEYSKAHEVVEIISNHVLNQRFLHKDPVKSVVIRDSKETPSIQLCDLLLGAVMETWQKKATNPAKLELRRMVARHLGWTELDSDTFEKERKFNIWYFFDPPSEQRKVVTQPVRLRHPYQ